jgi:hypothetical protein
MNYGCEGYDSAFLHFFADILLGSVDCGRCVRHDLTIDNQHVRHAPIASLWCMAELSTIDYLLKAHIVRVSIVDCRQRSVLASQG